MAPSMSLKTKISHPKQFKKGRKKTKVVEPNRNQKVSKHEKNLIRAESTEKNEIDEGNISKEIKNIISSFKYEDFSWGKSAEDFVASAPDDEAQEQVKTKKKRNKNKATDVNGEIKSKSSTDKLPIPNVQRHLKVKNNKNRNKNITENNVVKSVKHTTDGVQVAPQVRVKKPRHRTRNRNGGTGSNLNIASQGKISEVIDNFINNYKFRQHQLIKSKGKWHEQEFIADPDEFEYISNQLEKKIELYASSLLQAESNEYRKSQSRRSDYSLAQTLFKSGTLKDRMAAMTLLIQDSPIHNLQIIDNFLSLVTVKSRRECLPAAETLRDIFLSDLLLENRKLKNFIQHPFDKLIELSGGNRDAIEKRLILWYFEDQLKKRYVNFLDALDALSRDSVEVTKHKAVAIMYELLVSNAEQEEILLCRLVNKLGDPMHKAAARAAQKLSLLVNRHPNMKSTVTLEVERLIFRPNIGARAQYYGICFLNQLILSHEEETVATRLISIYFSLFKYCVKKGEVDTKMMSALLTGVNRAYPYAKNNTDKISEQLDTMHKVVHTVSFNVSLQALMLIYQVLDAKQNISDRFYSSLYRKILDPELSHTSKQSVFLNLMFKAMRKDENLRRSQAFAKRLLQVCYNQQPPMICGILYLLSEVMKMRPRLLVLQRKVAFYQDGDDDEEEHFVDVDKLQEDSSISLQKPPTSIGNHNPDEEIPTLIPIGSTPPSNKSNASSWNHLHNAGRSHPHNLDAGYDPYHRNPSYAGAEHSCSWELMALSRHYHPSVALFAQTLLLGRWIMYSGDPLQDFSLIRFLDRFVYRNPKQLSDNDKDLRSSVLGRRKHYVPSFSRMIPVHSKEFSDRKERMVPVEERFLFRYFSEYAKISKTTKKKDDNEDDSDLESVNSDEFDALLSKFEPGEEREEFDLDFASEFATQKNKKKKSKRGEDASESDDDLEEDDFENDPDFQEAFKEYDDDLEDIGDFDFDEEGAAFSDEDEDGPPMRSNKGSKRGNKFDSGDIFAAAEEFASVMDENADDAVDTTSMNAMVNKDNAAAKQLKWEMSRDQWVRNKDWKSKKRSNFNRKPPGGKQNKRKFNQKPDKRSFKRMKK